MDKVPLVKFLEWVSTLSCVVCGGATYHGRDQSWRCDPAHVKSRGSGGNLGLGNVVPLCRIHHTKQHGMGTKVFEREFGINLKEKAKEVEERWHSGNMQSEE